MNARPNRRAELRAAAIAVAFFISVPWRRSIPETQDSLSFRVPAAS